jgi:hypothetical protein
MMRHSPSRFQLRLEALEDRCVPSTISISDFLNAQGQTSVFNYGVPGLPDEIGWTTSTATVNAGTALFARIDYTGQDAAFLHLNLGTTTSGTVSDHLLSDGKDQVTVNLHTHNAFAFAQKLDSGAVLFGYTPDQLAANPNLLPPVGHSDLQLVYKAAPDAPPPDIVNAFILGGQPGYDLVSLSFRATAQGTTPTGQQATLVVSETGVLGRTPVPIRDGGFTAEVIDIQTHGDRLPPGAPAADGPTASVAPATLSPAHASGLMAIDAALDATLWPDAALGMKRGRQSIFR